MFKFFPDPDGTDVLKQEAKKETDSKEFRLSEEIQVKQVHYDIAGRLSTSVAVVKNTSIPLKYIRVADLLVSSYVKDDPKVKGILESSSDLQSGLYEGGFKTWECTFDLLKYLEEHSSDIKLGPGTKVLDLGCGSGLLGLYALGKGSSSVIFQDYNSEVEDFLTIPNTIVNFDDEGLAKCRYFSGDWGSFQELLEERKRLHGDSDFTVDIALSSETIYNIDYIPNFISLIKCCLKPTGSLYLAAKTCYFGVGGGTKAFTALLDQDSSLKSETVKVIREGIQREILHVRWNTSALP